MSDPNKGRFEECLYCGYMHSGTCPRIEQIEYYPDGATKRVKLRDDAGTHLEYDWTPPDVAFAEQSEAPRVEL